MSTKLETEYAGFIVIALEESERSEIIVLEIEGDVRGAAGK